MAAGIVYALICVDLEEREMKKYDELTRLLDFMEENINLDFVREIENLHYDAINFKRIDRLPLTVCIAPEGFDQVPSEIAFENPEMMLFNEILFSELNSSYNSVRIKDDSPLMIRSNHGIGIVASMFGCKSSVCTNQTSKGKPLTLDEAKKVFSKGVPSVKNGLGKKVIDTYTYYHERLKSYPKCYRAIHITQPDILGPYDILNLIIGDEALSLPHKNADLTKYMIDVITHTCINFRKEVDLLLTDKINDAVFANSFCCGGRILIKASLAAKNLSPEMYELYEAEPNSCILSAFSGQGGGSIHYPGMPKPWYKNAILDKDLKCVYYANSDMYNLQEEYTYYKEHNVALVGWGTNQEYSQIKESIKVSDNGRPILTGMTLICKADTLDNGAQLIKSHRYN